MYYLIYLTMKPLKSICILVVTFFVTTTFAQTSKGKFLLSGSSSFSITTTADKWKSDNGDGVNDRTTAVSLTPMAGFFVIKNLAVGLELQVGLSSTKKDEPADKTMVTTFTAAPFARYYFGAGKIKPYGHVSIGGGTRKYKSDPVTGATTTDKNGIMTFQVGGGIGIFLNDNVSLDLGLNYSYYSTKAKENNDPNYKNIDGTIGLYAGIVVIL
jgi:outer membrane protein